MLSYSTVAFMIFLMWRIFLYGLSIKNSNLVVDDDKQKSLAGKSVRK